MQFLLTNLGLALGITVLKYRPQSPPEVKTVRSENNNSVNISLLAGLGILLTLNSVLFVACFLAVRFSTASDPISGATLGIVIWSTYFMILIWASYSAVGSVTSWIFGSVATKLHQLIKAIASLIQGTEESASELLTEEATAKLIQQEIKTAFSKFNLQQRIDDYLQTLPSPELDFAAISQGFTDLVEKLDLESVAETDLLPKIDRQTFVTLIDEHTNLSNSQVESIVDRLERVWQQVLERYQKQDVNQKLLQFLQSANPEELQFEQLVKRLEQIVDNESESSSVNEQLPQEAEVEIDSQPNFHHNNWNKLNWQAIKKTLLKRVDLSDVELEDIWHSCQTLYQKFNSSENGLQLPFNTISNDVEDFLWHAPPWYLRCERGWQEFKEIIYDPQADPIQVRDRLKQVQPENFVQFLQQRNDLDLDSIKEITDRLEAVRQDVFAALERAELAQQKQQLSDRLKNYLQTAKLNELQENNLSSKLEELLVETGATTEVLIQFLDDRQQLNWHAWLEPRQDLEPDRLKQTAEQLSQMGDRLLANAKAGQVQIASTVKELQHKLESYFRYTNLEHLTREKIAVKLEQLWQEAKEDLPPIQQQLPAINFDELIQILDRRKELETTQFEAIVSQIKTYEQKLDNSNTSDWQLETISAQLSDNLVNYLYQALERKSNLAEMEADLLPLLNFARGKTSLLIDRQLAKVNWDEIEAQLKQVQQYSENQIQQTIKQAKAATRKLIRLPRRWLTRTSKQAKDVVEEIENFLSHSHKIDLTPKYLEHNLESIFQRAKTEHHSPNYLDRLAELSPSNITNLLTSRNDLTPVEIAQISDRSIDIIRKVSETVKIQQQQSNQLIQDLLDRLKEYFSSLNLLDIDRDRLKESLTDFDWQSLIDSWQDTISQIPIPELGDRLGELSDETVTIITNQTNQLLSELNLASVPGIQDYIVRQIDTIKLSAYKRTETIKQQTLQQIEATRKAIATAAYWMFAISFTSAIASVIAGYLATTVAF